MANPRDTKRPTGTQNGVTRDLASRIAQARKERLDQAGPGGAAGDKDMTGLARGMRIGTEFIAAVLVGAVIGYIVDALAGTGPWAMLVFVLLGFAAGIMNVIRVVAEMNAASPAPPGSDLGPEQDDEER
jgi:ATP synthase protein I